MGVYFFGMATHIRHTRNPEAPPRRVDRPRFGEESGEGRWPLARLRHRLASRLTKLLRLARPREDLER